MSRRGTRLSLGRAVVLAVLVTAPASAALAQSQSQAEPREPDRVPWFRPPNSIQLGRVRIDFRVRLHQDVRRFSPDADPAGWETTFRRARVGVQGRVSTALEYDFDAELRDGDHPLRNAFINYSRYEVAEIRAGRFKVPFGREQLASIFEYDFIERSLINTALVPTRDTGVMVHGEVGDGILMYRTGVFAHDGDSSRVQTATGDRFEDVRAGDGSWAGRLVVSPWAQTGGALRRTEVAGAMTVASIDEGLFGPEGRTLSGYRFSRRVFVRGRRTRVGLDGAWTRGPVTVQAEYIRLRDERASLGPGNVDVPDAVAQGWYVSAAWTLTGEPQGLELSPSRPLFRGGFGALELAGRVESLGFRSAGSGGDVPSVEPRAANILENRDRILTFGINWYPNRWSRLQIHLTSEHLQDPERTPVPGRTTFRGLTCRLQLVM